MAEEEKTPKPRTNPRLSKTIGKESEKSRSKADAAKDRANEQVAQADPDSWPRTPSGKPMAKILMTASELIPTGNFANVSIGPAQITMFIDPDDPEPLTAENKENLAKAVNELAEIVEGDVIAVQRNLVLENLQEQASSANSK